MNRSTRKELSRLIALVAAFGSAAGGCGKQGMTSGASPGGAPPSSGSGLSIKGLNQLPSAASMIQATSSTQSLGMAAVSGGRVSSSSVQGTPPTLASLDSENADQYFWNGLVKAINQAQSATSEQATDFFGSREGGPAGHGGCFMAQSVGENIGRVIRNGNSQCYMKGIVSVPSGVTVESGNIPQAELFNQVATDRVIRVNVVNFPETEGPEVAQDFEANIRIHGSDSVSAGAYKASLWFCSNGQVTGRETLEVDRVTGKYTAKHVDTHTYLGESSVGQDSITAYLETAADGGLAFDSSRDRTAASLWMSKHGKYKGETLITGDNRIFAKGYSEGSCGESSCVNRYSSVSSFSGSDIRSLRFLEGAYKGISEWGDETPHGYSGATEFNGEYYAALSSSPHDEELGKVDLEKDAFFAQLERPSPDFSDLECGGAVDAEVKMDFSAAEVLELEAKCEQESIRYDLCNGDDVRSAMNTVFDSLRRQPQ